MKILEIANVALRVNSDDKIEEFYTEVLELPKAYDALTPDGKVHSTHYLLPSGQFVEIVHDETYSGENRKCDRSHFHACFEIDARHEAYRDMAKKNVDVSRSAVDSVGMCGSWCSFFTDPEGNEWEMMEFSPISRQLSDQMNNMAYLGQ
jgi:catechol-2,3-dioxygenase